MSNYHLNTYQYSERPTVGVKKYIDTQAVPTGQVAGRIDDLVYSRMDPAHPDWSERQYSRRVQVLVGDLRALNGELQGAYIEGDKVRFYSTKNKLVEIIFRNKNGKIGVISEQPLGAGFTWNRSCSRYRSFDQYTSEQQAAIAARNKELSFVSTKLSEGGIDNWLDDEMLKYSLFTGNSAPIKYADIGLLIKDFGRVRVLFETLQKSESGKYALEDWSERTHIFFSKENYLRLKIISLEPHKKFFEAYVDFRFYEEVREDGKESTLQWINPYPEKYPHASRGSKFSKALVYPLARATLGPDFLPITVPSKPEDYLLHRHSHLMPPYIPNSSKELVLATGDDLIQQQREILDALPPTFIQGVERTTYVGQDHANIHLDPAQISEAKKAQHAEWKETLLGMRQLFDVIGIPFWLDAGTAIGAYRYRGGAIMPWDHDADIACLQADFDRIYSAFTCTDKEFHNLYKRHKSEFLILNTANYEMQNWSQETEGKNNKNYLRLKMKKADNELDIYMYTINPETGNVFWNDPYPGDMPYLSWHKEIPLDVMFPLKKAQFYGEWYSVPAKMETYLKSRYGQDLSPNHVWDPKQGDWVKKSAHGYFSIQDK